MCARVASKQLIDYLKVDSSISQSLSVPELQGKAHWAQVCGVSSVFLNSEAFVLSLNNCFLQLFTRLMIMNHFNITALMQVLYLNSCLLLCLYIFLHVNDVYSEGQRSLKWWDKSVVKVPVIKYKGEKKVVYCNFCIIIINKTEPIFPF